LFNRRENGIDDFRACGVILAGCLGNFPNEILLAHGSNSLRISGEGSNDGHSFSTC